MLPRKFFESLHAVIVLFCNSAINAILVLFEYFSGEFCLNVLIVILNASPNMMHFVRSFAIMRA